MRSYVHIVLGLVMSAGVLMILILGFHIGGDGLLRLGAFFPLTGAFIGGVLVLVSVNIPCTWKEQIEPWQRHEKLSWILIGCACLAWGIAECFWQYYVAHGRNPFPSVADIGYSSFFPLVFLGLILQQASSSSFNKRAFLLLDSMVAMGALLSIAWFFLLGSLAQTPTQSVLAKVLVIYYPATDIALLSCVVFLLLREHDHSYMMRARCISLVLIGVGLTVYASSDFLFNVLQNMSLSVDTGWVNLGWPLGMMTLGCAACTRRFLPVDSVTVVEEVRERWQSRQIRFGIPQAIPYCLLIVLFIVLAINVLSTTKIEQSIRPVLMIATLIVVGLVIMRQIITILDNRRLVQEQITTLERLEQVYQDVEQRQKALEAGVAHLKEVQTRLANGDVRARAQILNGDLWPLASGLNIMADRMMRSEQRQKYAQSILRAISDLNQVLEHRESNTSLILPASWHAAPPELHHFLQMIGFRSTTHFPPAPLDATTSPLLRMQSSPSRSEVTEH